MSAAEYRKMPVKKKDPVGLTHIKTVLAGMGLPFDTEYRFHPVRRWRFDIAIFLPDNICVAVEYDGIMSAKSRHTSCTGFTGDCDKTNAAAVLGWKILRYTVLNFRNFKTDLETLTS